MGGTLAVMAVSAECNRPMRRAQMSPWYFFSSLVAALASQMVASMLEYGSSSVHGRLVVAVGW